MIRLYCPGTGRQNESGSHLDQGLRKMKRRHKVVGTDIDTDLPEFSIGYRKPVSYRIKGSGNTQDVYLAMLEQNLAIL
jgi:hypothetical protein